MATAKRYEFQSATSHKFWEVRCARNVLQVRFGRVGTDGQTREKPLASTADAQREAGRLVREKLGKGYRAVGGTRAAKRDGQVHVRATQPRRTENHRSAGAPLATAVMRQLKRLGAVLAKRSLRTEPAPITHFANVGFSRIPKEMPPLRRTKGVADWKAWLKAQDGATIRWEIGGKDARDPLGRLDSIPPAIASFVADVRWTKPVFEDDGVRVEKVDFSGASGGLDVDLGGARRILIVIAMTAEKYHMTYLDLLDTAADPMTYTSDQDQVDVVATRQRLSGFLRGLSTNPRRGMGVRFKAGSSGKGDISSAIADGPLH
jgi:predicted DNA-binding WGR domain protein